MPSVAATGVGQGVLELRWLESAALRRVGVDVAYVVLELQVVDQAVAISSMIALEQQGDVYDAARRFPTAIRGLAFGSPLTLSVDVPRAIVEFSPALGFLIYALKRAAGFDLELRTRREEMRANFLEAQARSLEAEKRYELLKAEFFKEDRISTHLPPETIDPLIVETDGGPDRFSEMDKDLGWPKGSTLATGGSKKYWEGDQAVLRIDDE
jgi:hypothetical protein